LQEALAIWRNLGEDDSTATALNDLGNLARERKDYHRAERYYRQALELAQKIDHKDRQATCIANLGELALDRKQWVEARRSFEQALPLAQEVGRQNLIANVQDGLAHAWEAEGRPDLALPLAEAALAVYERLQVRELAEARELVARLQAKARE
jgi:tetratricopeptide (TPR) repeat protein